MHRARVGSSFLAFLAAVALVSLPSTAQGGSRPVLFSTQCANAHYKPTEIIISCADARAIFYSGSWTRWDATGARATGEFVHSDCPPRVPLYRCHHNTRDSASVYLYRVRYCRREGRRFFTRLLLTDHDTSNPDLRTVKLNYECAYVK